MTWRIEGDKAIAENAYNPGCPKGFPFRYEYLGRHGHWISPQIRFRTRAAAEEAADRFSSGRFGDTTIRIYHREENVGEYSYLDKCGFYNAVNENERGVWQ